MVHGLPGWLSGKESACQCGAAGDKGSIPESGRSLGGGNGNPFQYSCLENPMDRGAWGATVHRVAESDTTEWLSKHTHTHTHKHTHTRTQIHRLQSWNAWSSAKIHWFAWVSSGFPLLSWHCRFHLTLSSVCIPIVREHLKYASDPWNS